HLPLSSQSRLSPAPGRGPPTSVARGRRGRSSGSCQLAQGQSYVVLQVTFRRKPGEGVADLVGSVPEPGQSGPDFGPGGGGVPGPVGGDSPAGPGVADQMKVRGVEVDVQP